MVGVGFKDFDKNYFLIRPTEARDIGHIVFKTNFRAKYGSFLKLPLKGKLLNFFFIDSYTAGSKYKCKTFLSFMAQKSYSYLTGALWGRSPYFFTFFYLYNNRVGSR